MSKFQPGASGNPKGKKIGTLNKRTQLSKLIEPYAEELVNKAVELALSGDTMALRLCIERLIPKATDKSVTFVMPDLTSVPHDKILPELLRTLTGQELSLSDLRNLIQICSMQDHTITDERTIRELAELRDKYAKEYMRDY